MSSAGSSGDPAAVAYGYRADPGVPRFADDRPVILFDGHCVLCSGFAQFILKHDTRARFRLAAAQSPLGQGLYRHWGLNATQFETSILLQEGRPWFKSAAAIEIFRLLGFPWSSLVLLRVVPSRLLDALYDGIAARRLRWFGRRDVCFMPDPSQKDRFLE